MLFQNGGIFDNSPEDGNIQYWDGNRWVFGNPTDVNAIQLTVALFREGVISGDSTSTGLIDEELTTSPDVYTGEQQTFTFATPVRVKQYRHGTNASYDGDGVFKLQYYNLNTGVFTDFTGNITGNSLGELTDWIVVPAITTNAIRYFVVTQDSYGGGRSPLAELEVKY